MCHIWSHMKIIMCTCNSLVKPTFINSLLIEGTKTTEITNHFAQYNYIDIQMLYLNLKVGTLSLKTCSNSIDLFMHCYKNRNFSLWM